MQVQLPVVWQRDKVVRTIDHPLNETSSDKHKNALITMIKMDRAKWPDIWSKWGINRKVSLKNVVLEMDIENENTSWTDAL